MKKNNKKGCPFCNSSNICDGGIISAHPKFYRKNSVLMYCRGCFIRWICPSPNEKALSKIYSKIYHYTPSKFLDNLIYLYTLIELKSDLNLIKKFIKEGRVLDIGSGRGDFLHLFSDSWEKWVFDPYLSTQELAFAKKKVGLHVNDFNSLQNYPQNYFDLIILRNVIEHTMDFKNLITKVYFLLKRKGHLFIRTPNTDSVDFGVFRNNWYVIKMAGHVVFFNKISIKKYLEEAKLKVLFNQGIFRSYFLSYNRSNNQKTHIFKKLLISGIFSLISPFLGEGGDLRVLAIK